MRTTNPRQTRFEDPFSAEVFYQTYQHDDEDINQRHLAIAQEIASVELASEQQRWVEEFLDILEHFKFVPGGRITSNAGTGLSGVTYINCFVSGFRGEDQDSMESIMDELKRQALILKSEGGYGFCANVLRPRGAYIRGIDSNSPGVVKLLEMWDTQSAVITAGAGFGKRKIRKGAQMVTLADWHPDIMEFVTAKQTPGRLTKFNMSVLVSDSFMQALEHDLPWKLEFPDYERVPEEYKKFWDGNLDKWKNRKLPVRCYRDFDKARDLWDLIMRSTYRRNEPGVLFYDTINRLNNLNYIEHINATNPCGEQVLPIGGCCLLGSLNLTQFVNSSADDWNYEKLKKTIPVAIRFMDNVNDKSHVPLPENKDNLRQKRRLGLGVMGYASALMMLKLRYGSKAALKKTEELMSFVSNEAYRASATLAREKGSFALFNCKKYLKAPFIQSLEQDTISMIKAYGLRNSHLLSIQPTGNSAVLANNVSGGLEPIFRPEYIRTSIQPQAPQEIGMPIHIDWKAKTFEVEGPQTSWEWSIEGGENLLTTRHGKEVWKIDAERGLLKESMVEDYAVRYHKAKGSWNPEADWAATAYDLSIYDHLGTLNVFSKYVDSSLSKTVNVPEHYPFEDFERLYLDAYKSGSIKGCTTYREASMPSVLAAPNSELKCRAELLEE